MQMTTSIRVNLNLICVYRDAYLYYEIFFYIIRYNCINIMNEKRSVEKDFTEIE